MTTQRNRPEDRGRGRRPAEQGDTAHVTASNRANPVLVSAIEHLPPESLKPYAKHLRTIKQRNVDEACRSIVTYGFNNAILVDEDLVVIAGHVRLLAAKELGLAAVPVTRLSHLTPVLARAYRIMDNRLSELGQFDVSVLRIEVSELLDLGMEPQQLGYNTSEIDVILDDASIVDPDDEVPQPLRVPVCRRGDGFALGPHQFLCADALEVGVLPRLVGERRIRMVFADAPYNVRVADISGLGRTKHAEFAYASGEMSEAEFIAFLTKVFGQLVPLCIDGALWYLWMDHKHAFELMTAARAVGLKHFNLAVWDKLSGGMGSFYRSRHELCFVFKHGQARHINNVLLGKHGRSRDNVWPQAGLSSFGRGRSEDLAAHPTVKPLALAVEAIRDCTDRGDLVCDTFLGSGTTILAAERTGRVCYGTEIDPGFCDVIVQRWEKRTGIPAIHAETGLTFKQLAAARAAEAAPVTTALAGPACASPVTPAGPEPVRYRHRVRPAS